MDRTVCGAPLLVFAFAIPAPILWTAAGARGGEGLMTFLTFLTICLPPPSTKCHELRISFTAKQLSRPLCDTDCDTGVSPVNARDSAHPETPPVPHVPPKAAASRPACADLPAPQAGLRQAGQPEAPFARRPSPVACPLSPVNCRTFLHYNED